MGGTAKGKDYLIDLPYLRLPNAADKKTTRIGKQAAWFLLSLQLQFKVSVNVFE
jgi:hypothetical protein